METNTKLSVRDMTYIALFAVVMAILNLMGQSLYLPDF